MKIARGERSLPVETDPKALNLMTVQPEVDPSPAETGAVTLSLPQDVQAEAFEYPEEFFHKRMWSIPRNRCDHISLKKASEWIRAAKKPLIVAGGGILYSEASEALGKFVQATSIPVAETQAGKGTTFMLRFPRSK